MNVLLGHVLRLRDSGDRSRYDSDHDYRWTIHRLWIAIGNEALAFTKAAGLDHRRAQPWARLCEQRNLLAHQRLPDIDEDNVWRATTLRAEEYRAATRSPLR